MSVARSSLLFASGTLLSRVMGLVRDRLVLSVFGATGVLDAFVVAFRVPNMFREMLGEGSLGSAFTKTYSSVATKDPQRAHRLLLSSLYFMAIAATIICLLGSIAAPWLIKLMTLMSHKTTHGDELVATATGLVRLLFPFLGFMMIGSIVMGALHQRGRFFITSFSPVIFNLGYIFGALLLSQFLADVGPDWVEHVFASKMITGLALGVLIGGLGQVGLQIFCLNRSLRREGFGWERFSPWNKDVRKVLILMAPMALAAGAGQINMVVNTIFATSLEAGAVVWLYSSFRLLHLPIGLFGVAIGSAVLPALSRKVTKAGGRIDAESSSEIQNAVELVLWFMAPCFLFYVVNCEAVVGFLFQSGRFGAADVSATAQALYAHSFGLMGYGVKLVLVSFYFALDRTKYAMKVSLLGVLVNFIANYMLVGPYGHVGLAAAYGATLTVNALLLVVGLGSEKLSVNWTKFLKSILFLIVAAVLAGWLQSLCASAIGGLNWDARTPVWISAGTQLVASASVVVSVFLTMGLLYLGMSPKEAVMRLIARRHHR